MLNSRVMYLVMGEKCNLNCKYCNQHKNSKPKETFSPENIRKLMEYVKEQAAREGSYKILFYGGEPLIYWKEIVDMIEATKDIEGLYYGTVTNGLLLDEEKIEYINSLKGRFTFAVSWDGRNSKETRGFDAWETKKEILKKTPYFSAFSAVISTNNYIMDYLNDCEEPLREYMKAQNRVPSIYIETITSNLPNDKIAELDYEKEVLQAKEVWKEYLKGEKLAVRAFMRTLISQIRNKEETLSPDCGCCGTGTIDVDTSLNLYSCHCFFNEKLVGTLDTPKEELEKLFEKHLKEYKERKLTRCENCPVKAVCNGGCAMLIEENMDTYCLSQIARHLPIIEGIMNYAK